MNWVITGGCGFIGVNLVGRLLRDDERASVRVVDDLSASTREDLGAVCSFREVSATDLPPAGAPGVDLVVGDVRDRELALRATRGADVVVHLAACSEVLRSVQDPVTDCQINVLGTLNYLVGARDAGCSAFVLASSVATLGEQPPPVHEGKVPRPLSPYGASKAAGEAYLHAFFGSYDLPTVALRFANVYGPWSATKGSVIPKFIRQALAGEDLEIWGDGSQTRDFVYVSDLVDAILAAARADVGGEVFQIATHRETTVSEITAMLVDLLDERAGVRARVRHGEPMKGEIRRNFSDISHAKEVLGWEPATGLREGLSATVDWFLAQR